MNKRIIGILLIVVLVGVFLYSTFNKTEEKNKAPEQNTNGGVIMSENAGGIAVGEVAPDFELENLEGETVKLSDLQGKKVILNFWASWCPPCKKEMPEMQKFYETHHEDIEILAVNTSEKSPKNAKQFIEENGFTFPILFDTDSEIGRDIYKAIALPTTYFIGTDGIIQQERKIGPMTYDYMVEMMHSLE